MLSKEARVGVFVLLGSVVVGGLIFIIGDSRRLFELFRLSDYAAI